MRSYNEYIGNLKKTEPNFDGDKMYSQIQSKIKIRSRNAGLSWAGVFLILLGFSFYFGGYAYDLTSGQTLAGYILGQNDPNPNDHIMGYVFSD